MMWRLPFALFIALAAIDAARFRAPVFDPLHSLAVDASNAANETAPPVDRVFEYPSDFQLDQPFTISLSSHESVLVPLDPIRNKLFAESNAAIALGFELSACQGKVLTTLAMRDGASHRLSSANYQCTTMTKTPSTPRVDLCPIVHGDRDVAIHKDPTTAKGFILRAYESAEVVAIWRSTKDGGAYNNAFFVDADPVQAAAARSFNVSFSATSTQLEFGAARTWQPSDTNTTNTTCTGCEYAVYAELAVPSNSSDVLPQTPPPPHCLIRQKSITYTLPTVSSAVSQRVTLPSGFGDRFRASGDYSFVLVVSMPASANNGHAAYFTFTPARVSVTAPTHYTSHLLVALGVVAAVAFLCFVAVKSELPQRLMAKHGGSTPNESPHDDESVRLLAQVIAEQDAHDAGGDHDDSGEEERTSESLLDVIRKTKAQEATPQSSPRHPHAAQLEGYHEIN